MFFLMTVEQAKEIEQNPYLGFAKASQTGDQVTGSGSFTPLQRKRDQS